MQALQDGDFYLQLLVAAEDALVSALVNQPEGREKDGARERMDRLPPFHESVFQSLYVDFAYSIRDTWNQGRTDAFAQGEYL